MPKTYAIPVNGNNMYLALKSPVPPRGGAWCQNMPQPIGGNDGHEGPWHTLRKEAREETHHKITFEPGNNSTLVHKASINSTRGFFYRVDNAVYNPGAVVPNALRGTADYREMTGDVLVVNMNDAPSATRIQLARYLVGLTRVGYTDIQFEEFFNSESLKAIWKVVNAYRGNALPVA